MGGAKRDSTWLLIDGLIISLVWLTAHVPPAGETLELQCVRALERGKGMETRVLGEQTGEDGCQAGVVATS